MTSRRTAAWVRVRGLGARLGVGWRRLRATVRPGPVAWRGAGWGLVVAVTIGLAGAGSLLVSGRGLVVDALTAVVLGWLVAALLAGVLLGLGRLLRGIPPRLLALGVVAVVLVGGVLAAPLSPMGLVLAAVFLVAGTFVGAAVASLRPPAPVGWRRRVALTGAVVGVVGVVAVPGWIAWSVPEPDAELLAPSGPLAVTTLVYGSGDHPHRARFGAGVDVTTPTVDGTALLPTWSGLRGWLRTRYWGFEPDTLPLNATVWLPVTDEPGPLVLVVHGNHPMEVPSDEGYDWLGEELASHGYVVASVDQTFLNLSFTRGVDLLQENDARAWLLLEHLRLWRGWQDDPSSPLHGRADLTRTALVGHSRGGEAVAHAALFDQLERYPGAAEVTFDAGFDIDAVVAIAPVDGQYQPAGVPTVLEDVSYLTIHGGRDGDVVSFLGLRQFHRTSFSGQRPGLRAAVYLEDANHAAFNTVWGRHDLPGLPGRTLETGALIAGEDQRRDARSAIVAFLDAVLRASPDGLALLRDPAHPGWSADTRRITRHADSTEVELATFMEDTDPGTGTLPGTRIVADGVTVWREEPVPLRLGTQDDRGVVLAWEAGAQASVVLALPDGAAGLDGPAVLRLDLADAGEAVRAQVGAEQAAAAPGRDAPPTPVARLTVEAVDAAGTVTVLGGGAALTVELAPRPRRLRAPLLDPVPAAEPLAQTVELELEVAPGAVRELRLVLGDGTAGALRLDRVALAPAP